MEHLRMNGAYWGIDYFWPTREASCCGCGSGSFVDHQMRAQLKLVDILQILFFNINRLYLHTTVCILSCRAFRFFFVVCDFEFRLWSRLQSLEMVIVDYFIYLCIYCESGFGGNVGHDPHTLYTLNFVQVLALLTSLMFWTLKKCQIVSFGIWFGGQWNCLSFDKQSSWAQCIHLFLVS